MADLIDTLLSKGSASVEITITDLENELEAQILDEVLNEHQIPHLIKRYGDSAYGNVLEFGKGWGFIRAHEKDKETILAILEDIRCPNNYTNDAAAEAMGEVFDDVEAFIEAEDKALAKQEDRHETEFDK